jgi:hypothetical protein
MDFCWATRERRQVAVCVACEKVFVDEVHPHRPSLLSRLADLVSGASRRGPRRDAWSDVAT